jgi:hypothetical protein
VVAKAIGGEIKIEIESESEVLQESSGVMRHLHISARLA